MPAHVLGTSDLLHIPNIYLGLQHGSVYLVSTDR